MCVCVRACVYVCVCRQRSYGEDVNINRRFIWISWTACDQTEWHGLDQVRPNCTCSLLDAIRICGAIPSWRRRKFLTAHRRAMRSLRHRWWRSPSFTGKRRNNRTAMNEHNRRYAVSKRLYRRSHIGDHPPRDQQINSIVTVLHIVGPHTDVRDGQ